MELSDSTVLLATRGKKKKRLLGYLAVHWNAIIIIWTCDPWRSFHCIWSLFSFSSSSPKSKQEAMVRSPPVMSPSSAAQMDSKLPNQGKQGGAGSQSQPSPCEPKALSGSHTPKGPQGSVGSMGLKNGQGLNSGNGAKSKIKRERSTSIESFEQRDTGTPNNEGDQKGRTI